MVIGWRLGVFNTHFKVIKILIFKHKKKAAKSRFFIKINLLYFKDIFNLAKTYLPVNPN